MYSTERSELVRQALDKVLESPGFAQSPQLSSFLDYVVQKTLAGKAHELKGYTIGVEALGRREDFDPQTDTAVRVLAGRLRKALDNYYGEAGEKQPVQISIPKGGYVPVFSFLDDAADDKETSEQTTGATPAVHDRATQTANITETVDRLTGRVASLQNELDLHDAEWERIGDRLQKPAPKQLKRPPLQL